MLTGAEIRQGLAGAARLFGADPGGMAQFEVSARGFYRSFLAFWLLLPFLALSVLVEARLMLAERPGLEDAFPGTGLVLVRGAGALIDWFGFPVLAALVAHRAGLGGRYAGYVVAHNWAAVLMAGLVAIPWSAFALGWLNASGALTIQLVLLGVWLRYAYVLARLAFGASRALAVGLVALELGISLVLERLGTRLLGL